MVRLFFLTLIIFTFFVTTVLPFQREVVDVTQFEHLQMLGWGRIHDAAIHPDSRTIAIASNRGLDLYDLQTLAHLKNLSPYTTQSNAVVWSKDGTLLIAGLQQGKNLDERKIRFWRFSRDDGDEARVEEVLTIKSLANDILSLSPDGNYLAAGHLEIYAIKHSLLSPVQAELIYTSDDAKKVDPRVALYPFIDFAWSPDSRQLASLGSPIVRIWVWMITDEEIQGKPFPEPDMDAFYDDISWSPDGKYLTTNGPGYEFNIWNMETWQIENKISSEGSYHAHWFSNGQKLALSPVSASDYIMFIKDTTTWETIKTIELSQFQETILAWSPDDRFFATTSEERNLNIRDAATGQNVRYIPWQGARQIGDTITAWFSDSLILSATYTNRNIPRLYLWDTQTGILLDYVEFTDIEGDYWIEEFSPDLTYLKVRYPAPGETTEWVTRIWTITITPNNELIVHELENLETVLSNWPSDEKPVAGEEEAWSPDGKLRARLLETEKDYQYICKVEIYDSDEKQVIAELPDYISEFRGYRSLAWSPDGTFLAVSYGHGSIEIWNMRNYALVTSLDGWSLYLEWSPDGTQLLSFSTDDTIHIWGIPEGE